MSVLHDPKYLPAVFGLRNAGQALCYFNSMMQFLMSLTSFNKHMITNKEQYDNYHTLNVSIGSKYIELYERNNGITDPSNIPTDDASGILKALIQVRKKNGVQNNLHYAQQEDFHEGMHFMMEFVGGKALNLFKLRHKRVIQCRVCNQSHDAPQKYYDTMLNLFDENPQVINNLNSQEKIQTYIKSHYDVPPDYRCEETTPAGDICGAVNDTDADTGRILNANITISYRLARLSEIVILVFNKYRKKRNKFFPKELKFRSNPTNKMLHYKVVSQVEHIGSNNGGHYTVRGLRRKPPGFDEFRQKKFQKMVSTQLKGLKRKQNILQNKLIRIQNANQRGNVTKQLKRVRRIQEEDVRKSLTNITNKIAELTETVLEPTDDEVVFQFNDDRPPRYMEEGFQPTPNTYIVAYHLYKRSPL